MSVQLKEPLRSLRKCKKAWLINSTIRGKVPPSALAAVSGRLIHSSIKAAFATSHTEPQLMEEQEQLKQEGRQAYLFDTQQQQRSQLTTSQAAAAPPSQKLITTPATSISAMTAKQCEDLLSSLADREQWTHVIETFEKSTSITPTPRMYLTALKAYGRTKQVDKVLTTFETYKFRYRLKPSAYTHYVKAVIDCQDTPTAIRIFRDIYSHPRLKFQPVVSQSLALLLPSAIQQDFVQALKLVHAFISNTSNPQQQGAWHPKAIRPITQTLWQGFLAHISSSPTKAIDAMPAILSVATLEDLIDEYITTIQYQEEKDRIPIQNRDVFNLVRLACYQRYIEPTTRMCNSLIRLSSSSSSSSNSSSGTFDRHHFKSVLQWMKQMEIHPDAQTIALLIDQTNPQLISADKAKELYQTLKSQPTVNHSSNGVNSKLNSILCNTFIKWLSSEDVDQLEREAKEQGIMIEPSSMIDGFQRRKEFEEGWSWLQRQPQQLITVDMYATFFEGLLQAGKWNHLIRYHSLLRQQLGCEKIDAHQRIVLCALTALLAKKDMQGSLLFLKSLKIEMAPKHLHKIILTLCRLKSDKSGYPLVYGSHIVKSLRLMESTLHVYLDAERLARIILKLGHRGECLEAHMLYRYIREKGHAAIRVRAGDSRIYRAMMSAATLNNRIDLLEQTWHQMLFRRCRFLSEKFEKEQPTMAAYNILLNGYASQLPRLDIHRIKRTYTHILRQGLQPDLVTYNILIKAFVNCGKMDAAHQLFGIMLREHLITDDGGFKPLISSNTLLSGWIRQRQWDNVEAFMKDHMDKMDAVTFNLMVQCFLHLNPKTVTALKLLKYQHRWKLREKYQKEYSEYMSSDRIWNLFESVTGYTRRTIEDIPLVPSSLAAQISALSIPTLDTLLDINDTNSSRRKDGFIDAFVQVREPNEATYNIFMKAFYQVKDEVSAKKIYSWMKYLRQEEIL